MDSVTFGRMDGHWGAQPGWLGNPGALRPKDVPVAWSRFQRRIDQFDERATDYWADTFVDEPAELWFVSREMLEVALEASLSMPDAVTPEPPSSRGFILLAGNAGQTVYETGDGISTSNVAIYWSTVREESGRGILLHSFGEAEMDGMFMHGDPSLGSMGVVTDGVSLKETGWEASSVNREGIPVSGFGFSDAARLVVCIWSLSQTPTVADVTTHTPTVGPKIKGQRRRQAPSPVKVVELRQMKHQNVTHSPSGRKYTHRWIVRGHWRDQACGPGRMERRRTWVPSYTKGPADAPLLERPTVFAWRR